MKNLLGIGTAGSNIVRALKQHEQYKIYTISPENKKTTKYNFALDTLEDSEQYEKAAIIKNKIEKLQKQIEKL